jgi:hypothetical protein
MPDENLSTSDLAAADRNDNRTVEAGTRANETTSSSDAPDQASGVQNDAARQTALFSDDDSSGFRDRWMTIQTGFVDEPRQAVEQADALVAELMKRLAQTFAEERAKLEAQWGQGDNVGTEELRVALQRYRSFFERLLST